VLGTGQDTAIDDALASILLATVGQDMRQPDGAVPVFAQPVAVGDDAPTADRLVAFLGRPPTWAPATRAPSPPS
jgi:hypothetical protein